jgi:hypothetical protein
LNNKKIISLTAADLTNKSRKIVEMTKNNIEFFIFFLIHSKLKVSLLKVAISAHLHI